MATSVGITWGLACPPAHDHNWEVHGVAPVLAPPPQCLCHYLSGNSCMCPLGCWKQWWWVYGRDGRPVFFGMAGGILLSEDSGVWSWGVLLAPCRGRRVLCADRRLLPGLSSAVAGLGRDEVLRCTPFAWSPCAAYTFSCSSESPRAHCSPERQWLCLLCVCPTPGDSGPTFKVLGFLPWASPLSGL